MPLRYDEVKIVEERKDFVFTDEGFLQVTAIVTRTGVFNYRNADGSLRRELRHPDDVFLADSLDTMKLIPITLNHPIELVNVDNVKKYSVGNSGETVTVDGKYIRLKLTIQDKSAVDAILNGKDELSLGYTIEPKDEAGEYDGVSYDVRQTNITYNHLAVVDVARAGSEAKIKLDSGDAILITDDINKKDSNEPKQKKESKMPVFKLDGIDYEASQEVINHVAKLEKTVESKNDEIEKVKKDSVKMEAERDENKKKLDEAEAKLTPEALKERVDARVALEQKAKKVLDSETDISGMSEKDVKVAVLKKLDEKINLDGKSDDYIDARFDVAIEGVETKEKKDGTSQQLGQLNKVGDGKEEKLDADASRKAMFDRMQKRSRGETEEK